MMVMMMVMHDERVNVLNFFSFSGTPLDLAHRLGGSFERNDPPPPPFFFQQWDGALPSSLGSRLSRYC
jgi:hypothetical protein